MIILGLIFSFILDSKDSKIIDPLLLISRNEIFPWCSSTKVNILSVYFKPNYLRCFFRKHKDNEISKNGNSDEQETML
ncbi:unnamed protein product [Adineta steineri]|uniref:Uncharacterized protein n=1 Tax=Adineta steineri TaxID=433720 RepID=A0A815E5V3_9BILA|nr:unnamed protein product [Adineta steineri]CAF1307113.1 unnamed protein product [Adineta steineri]CAF1578059.1 unnamed protein product [Adineta steineri]CAF1578179.1 unnamed protein product [Adineta steineri]